VRAILPPRASKLAAGALLLALLGSSARVPAQTPEATPTPPPPLVTSLTLFAGTAEGLWRSTDWGKSWEIVRGRTSGSPLDGLGAARSILPLGPQVFVAGQGGFFLSSDFGETWERRGPLIDATVLLISRYPQADPTVFVGTRLGLLKSEDAGHTFRPAGLAGPAVHRLEWPGPALVAGTRAGVLVSMDGGATFEGPGTGLGPGEVRGMALSSFFGVDPVMFAAPGQGVYRSGDGGKSWAPAGLEGETVFDLVWLGPFLYAAGEKGFHRSEDAGKSWRRLSDSPGRPSRLLFPLAPAAGLEAFLATDRGVFRTADAGEHWFPSGLVDKEVLTVATFPPPSPMSGRKPRR
jgi:photosystem II stability/assembly factor-like uncharacterized protein